MKLVEIFQSIDGEVNVFHQGRLSTFIRFANCNLECKWCDTKYANQTKKDLEKSPQEIFEIVQKLDCSKVTITGGEPLLQPQIFKLIDILSKKHYLISVETNGTCVIPLFWIKKKNISWIVDYKLDYPGQMILSNYLFLQEKDWIKFAVRINNAEINRAIDIKNQLQSLECKAMFAISPISAQKTKKGGIQQLINHLVKAKQWDFIVNLQIHKFANLK